jgi:uncharacterized protein (TIGR03067 family)
MKLALGMAATAVLMFPAGEPAGDHKDIQGSWRVLILMDSGETVPIAPKSRLIIARDKLKLDDKNYPIEVTYTLDPAKTPRVIDLGSRTAKYPGIYELQGNSLRICYNERPNGERPTLFASIMNMPSDVLLVLERDKK